MQQEYFDTCNDVPRVSILFQPHHGRKSGSVPEKLLEALDPQLIIIGNAPCDHIDYDNARMTITQNSSGDLLFENDGEYVHIYSQNKVDNLPKCLEKLRLRNIPVYKGNHYYCGSLKLK